MQVNGVNSGSANNVDSKQAAKRRGISESRREQGAIRQRTTYGDSVTISSKGALARKEGEASAKESAGRPDQGATGLQRLGDDLKEFLTKTRDFFRRIWNGTGAEVGLTQAPVLEEKGADSLWERFKLKVYTASGYLAKRFGGDPALQASVDHETKKQDEELDGELEKERQPEEAGEKKDIEQDRSYLMDSYDRTGKYTKLGERR